MLPLNFLCIDCSSIVTQVGIFDEKNFRWKSFFRGTETAVECVDLLIQNAIDAAHLTPRQINRFLVCEGPGSLLGLRTAKIFTDVWTQLSGKELIVGYNALQLVGRDFISQGMEDFSLIAPVQRGKLFFLSAANGILAEKMDFISMEEFDTFVKTRGNCFVFPVGHWEDCVKTGMGVPLNYNLEKMGKSLGEILLKTPVKSSMTLRISLSQFEAPSKIMVRNNYHQLSRW
jgi:tRNA A37 threonylcarbamoyladenosine modification protein TsaB